MAPSACPLDAAGISDESDEVLWLSLTFGLVFSPSETSFIGEGFFSKKAGVEKSLGIPPFNEE